MLAKGKVTKLAEIAQATQAGAFVWAHPISMHDIVKAGFAEAHPTMRSDDGVNATETGKMQAYRASHTGLEYLASVNQPEGTTTTMSTVQPNVAAAAVATPKAAPMAFEIETGFAPSSKPKRGGRRPDVYPFDKLEVGQSFFVPATEARPEPWKSLASTVNTAMQRYAATDATGATRVTKKGKTVSVTTRTRHFQMEKGARLVDGAEQVGARIFRTA